MSYQRPIRRPAADDPARSVVIAIDGGTYVPRSARGLSRRRRITIILGVSAALWAVIAWLIVVALR